MSACRCPRECAEHPFNVVRSVSFSSSTLRPSRRVVPIGTHNLHDSPRALTPFADLILLTEVPTGPTAEDELRRALGSPKWGLLICDRQRSLALAYRRDVFVPTELGRDYRRAHEGRADVTPGRGTWHVPGSLLDQPTSVLIEHRINAAFPPYVRGEEAFRRACWREHRALTTGWARDLEERGRLVIAGGDPNTPHHVKAYQGRLQEVGRGADRLAVSHRGGELGPARYLSRSGSDHPRVRAMLQVF